MNKYITLLAILGAGIISFFILPSFPILFSETGTSFLIFSFIVVIIIFYSNIKKLNLLKQHSDQKLKKTKEDYLSGEKRLKLTIENIQEGILITDNKGEITDVNRKSLYILDTTRDKIIGLKVQNLIHLKEGKDNLNFSNTFRVMIENKESFSLSNLVLQVPNTNIVKNIDDSLSPILDEFNNVIGTVMIFRDVTNNIALQREKENLIQKVDQLERISVLGDFLTGIAHNFGNVISSISGSVEMMKQSPSDTILLEKYFKKIDKKVEESKQLIKKLSVFNASIESEKTPTNINELIDINKTSLLKILPSDIDVNVSLKSESKVKIDMIDFDRIFLTVLSYLKRNNVDSDFINIKTYDDKEYSILEFESRLVNSDIDFYIFNIEEILQRNSAMLETSQEEEKTKVKILFKI